MRKKLIGSIAVCAAVGLAFFGFAACDKSPVGSGPSGGGSDDDTVVVGGQLDSVDVSTVKATEEIFVNGNLGTTFAWNPVENATGYKFTCNGTEVSITRTSIILQNYSQITLPGDGHLDCSIIATAYGFDDSDSVSFSYDIKGCELKGITVTSFDNGIIKWADDHLAKGYIVSVNGGAPTTVTEPEFNLAPYSGALTVQIRSAGDGMYTKTGTPFIVNVDAAHSKLHLLPIEDYTISNGVISWNPIAGVTKYKIVDIERNTKVTEELSYDYSEKLPLYGVYPISDNDIIADPEIAPVNIPYLSGDGTQASPYKIKSPMDFRAIDYYEAVYADKLKTGSATKNYYIVDRDIDFNSVNVLEEESNFYALTQPFYGRLNGNNKELSNIRIRHRSGYWAMFDYIASSGEVMNMKFASPDIQNSMIQPTLPINASIATVAYKNYGTISYVTVTDANYRTAGGEVAGICWDNRGTVSNCTLGGRFVQNATGQPNQACFEMAGIVADNNGTVSNNSVTTLEISGTAIPDGNGSYNNVRCAAGIVAVNRYGATVSNNSFTKVTMTTVLSAQENEFGGVVAYNAGTVVKGAGSLGTFIHNGDTVYDEVGDFGKPLGLLGKLIGKDEGTRS